MMMHHLEVPFISKRTFYRHQKYYLIPVINDEFHQRHSEMVHELNGRDITLGGDARYDSPGHSAKYALYTFVDMTHNTVTDIRLVQVGYIQLQQNSAAKDLQF